jgi:hypothetical protein
MIRTAELIVILGLLCLAAGAGAAALQPPAALQSACRHGVVEEGVEGRCTALSAGRVRVGAVASLLQAVALGAHKVGASLRLRGGAKSKNHTNHNQNRKAHRNGIKRVKT